MIGLKEHWNKLSKTEKIIFRVLSYIAMLLAILATLLLLSDRIKENLNKSEPQPKNIDSGT